MKLLQFLRREAKTPLRRLAIMAIISGLANALVLVVINISVQNATEAEHSFLHLVMFLLVTGIYIVSQRHLMIESWTEIEQILRRIRWRIAEKIRDCDFEPIEKIGRSQIYTSLSREPQILSQSAVMLVLSLQSAVLLIFAVVYVAWLSLAAFFTFVAVSSVAITMQMRNSKRLDEELMKSMMHENKLLDTLTHALDGFVEIKMNPRRSDDLYEHLGELSETAAAIRVEAKGHLARMFIFGQTMLYVLVAAMIFVVPRLSQTYDDVIVQAATAMLFLTGPLSTLVGSAPDLANAGAAVSGLAALEAELDGAVRRLATPPDAEITSFEKIHLEGLVFQFHQPMAEHPFTLGPISGTVEQGEVLFIVGGNGSGKTTFLRMLLGLYDPDQGMIRVDGEPINERNLQAYRNLFSVVFADFHLFDRLYGLGDVEESVVTELLEEMELSHKVSFSNGEFSTLELSTGQRKRLAYIVSRLEDRQIYVFDEWAASQDPVFRQKFYEKLLPQLRERGKTIIAVTHDDRFWDFADRILKMDEGGFVES